MKKIKFISLETFYGTYLHGQFKCAKCGLINWSSMGWHGNNGKSYCGKCKNILEKNF